MLGTTGLLLLVALVAWQLALVGWSAVAGANAARTAARAYSRTGDATSAQADGMQSLQNDGLGAGSSVDVGIGSDGTSDAHAHVVVRVPMLVPEFLKSPIKIPSDADIPRTG